MEPNPTISKLILTQRDDFYYIEVYESSNNSVPKYISPFPFPPKTQQEALEKARSFGKEMSQKHGIALEEKL